jgi:hypothetical protein
MSITAKPRGNVVNYYSGSADRAVNKTTGEWTSLMITNDGAADLTITVNSLPMIVKTGETLDEDFVDFNQVTITTTVAYRLWLRE